MRALFFLLIGFVLYAQPTVAITYYISDSGDDSNNGTSESSAWATIDKVNAMASNFQAGDQILFERGGEFRGMIQLSGISGSSSNPIIFGAYGSGPKPIIKGSKEITNWVNSGNIWQADCPDCPDRITNLFINGKFQTLGRYPNHGYRTATGSIGESIFEDSNLGLPDGYFEGGEAVIFTADWIIDWQPILTQISGRFTLTGTTTYGIPSDVPYFIQNHVNTLDTIGEWAFDKSLEIIYVFHESNLNGTEVEISFYRSAFDLENCNFIKIENLHLTHVRTYGVYADECKGLNFSNNDLTYSGGNGIDLLSSSDAIIDNNYIYHTNNNAINTEFCDRGTYSNNVIKRTAVIPGRGWNLNGQYIGISILDTEDSKITNNRVDSTGYIGINWIRTKNALIKNNYVTYSCITKHDGAGLYTVRNPQSNDQVIGNIVLYTGTFFSLFEGGWVDCGIYVDDESSDIIIDGNTTAYNIAGIFVHNSNSIVVKNNLSYNNSYRQLLMIHRGGENRDVYNCEITNNIFFSIGELTTEDNQLCIELRYLADPNVFDYNFICDPFKDWLVYEIAETFTEEYTMNTWQQAGHGLHSKPVPIKFSESGLTNQEDFILFDFNPSSESKSIELQGAYRNMEGEIISGSININPYRSIILLKENRTILSESTKPSGEQLFCSGEYTNDYTTTGDPNATSYDWNILPGSAGSISGDGTTATVNWNASFSGEASIYFLGSGSGDYKSISPSLDVTVLAPPNVASPPEGDTALYTNSPNTDYSTLLLDNVTGYEWQLTPSTAGTVTGNMNTAEVSWDPYFSGYAWLSVRATNECGTGEFSNPLQISITDSEKLFGVPNVFTPNQDGYNDRWDLPFVVDFPEANIKIYDRSNELVVEYTGIDPSWNGTVMGKRVPMGNYLYIIDLKDGRRPLRGYVTIIY